MTNATEQRKLAAIMFTDMVGYSALSQRDDKLALELLEEHRELLRKIFPQFNGTEIKTIGDAFLVEFNSALEAAQCAIEIQRKLAHRNADAPSDRQIELKIGIHIGDVVHRGGDVYGDGVNIASRIEPLAGAGGICVSMDVERQIRNAVETRFEKLGPTELKNISVPMELFRIVLPWERSAPPTVKTENRKPKSETIINPATRWIWVAAILLILIGVGWWWRSGTGRISAGRPDKNEPVPRQSEPAPIPEKSIAVLPFENLSEDKSNAFFADGVQDEILTDLAKIADLKVISRTSVMQYRNAAGRNLREIGKQLGVAHVVEGTVQRAADKVRVNTQLINARTDVHEWAENYDRPVNDVFAIQSEIAQTIAEQLKAHLSPTEKAAIAQAPTKDIVANDLYLRSRALDDMSNDPGAKGYLLQGITLLEEALRRDPNFVSAQCLLSEIYTDLFWFGFDHSPARLEQAHAALQQAERIAPNTGEVHMSKGLYAYHGFRDYEQARKEFELARESLPNSSRLFLYTGVVDRRQARWDDAFRNMDRAVELDPRNFLVLEEAGFTYGGRSHWDAAKGLLERAIQVSPKDYFARIQLASNSFYERGDLGPLRAQLNVFLKEGSEATTNAAQDFIECALAERDQASAAQALTFIPAEGSIFEPANFLTPRDWFVGLVARSFGDTKEAQRAFTAARVIAAKTVQDQPDYAAAWSWLGMIDAGLGRKADAIAEGKRACELLPISKDAWEAPIYITNLALIYAWVGEKDLALEQLTIAAQNAPGISYGDLKLDPRWDSLRGDPRFEKLVASLAPKDASAK